MFGPSTTFSTPTAFTGQPSSFNYFHSNGDYNTWGSQLGGQRKYDDYYRDHQNIYTQAMPDSLKSVEQAMQNLGGDTLLRRVSLLGTNQYAFNDNFFVVCLARSITAVTANPCCGLYMALSSVIFFMS